MIIYAEYEYYTESFRGSLIPDVGSFIYCARTASQYINTVTFNRIVTENDITEAVRNACCAAAEVCYTSSVSPKVASGITTEKIGDYSVTYGTSESSSMRQKRLFAAVKLWLGNTGLMYRGNDNNAY